jgi:hypothetical protein
LAWWTAGWLTEVWLKASARDGCATLAAAHAPAPAFEQEPDAPFGFVIQFSIIFILATSSTRPEMISVSRATPLVRPCVLGRREHNGTIGPFEPIADDVYFRLCGSGHKRNGRTLLRPTRKPPNDQAQLFGQLQAPSAVKSSVMAGRIAIGLRGPIKPGGIGRGARSFASWLAVRS